MKIIGIIKADFMTQQLFWIGLECTGVPNKVEEYTAWVLSLPQEAFSYFITKMSISFPSSC